MNGVNSCSRFGRPSGQGQGFGHALRVSTLLSVFVGVSGDESAEGPKARPFRSVHQEVDQPLKSAVVISPFPPIDEPADDLQVAVLVVPCAVDTVQ